MLLGSRPVYQPGMVPVIIVPPRRTYVPPAKRTTSEPPPHTSPALIQARSHSDSEINVLNEEEGRIQIIKKYPNGSIYMRYTMKNGVKDGLYEEFYEDGTPRSLQNYKDGKRHGMYKDFRTNGKIFIEGNYKDNKPDGDHFIRFEDGSIYSSTQYKMGNFHGFHISNYPNGRPRLVSYYQDRVMKSETKYDEDGQPIQ
jgi:antitoxin component YwqK of YwqJK toxin-antitoxin module